jgi:hypothetical protein
VSETSNLRFYGVDEHFFRVHVDKPSAPAEVLTDDRWVPVVLTAEEVAGLINARELASDEIDALDLPD